MKKRFVFVLALMLALTAALPAMAGGKLHDVVLEKVEYMGFGIIELEFDEDCDWRNEAQYSLKDTMGFDLSFELLGNDDEEAYIYLTESATAPRIADGASCTLTVTTAKGSQSIDIELRTGQEYEILHNGSVRVEFSDGRCDRCGAYDHDDDFCPETFDAERFYSWFSQGK